MKKSLALAAAVTVFLAGALHVMAAGPSTDGTQEGSVSGNTAVSDDNAIEIPGWGTITQSDIDELAGYTRDATGNYLEQNTDRPLIITREPDTVLTYDSVYERYRYTFPDGQWIESNVPQGAYHRGSVEFITSQGITAVMHYKDGVSAAGKGPFAENGSYAVVFWDLNVEGDANRAYRLDYCFTIYSDYCMNLSHIEAPGGMGVYAVTLDGVLLDPEPLPAKVTEGEPEGLDFGIADTSLPHYVHLKKDGTYHIVFGDGECGYEMDFIRDTTPPVIRFTPEYRLGKEMDCEVSYQLVDPAADLKIYRNHIEVELPAGKIPVNGNYRLVVSDTAGNERSYSFSVRAPVQMFSKKMLLIPVVLLLLAVLAGLYWRRNMQVR